MREIRQSGSEGGARFNPLSLPLSPRTRECAPPEHALAEAHLVYPGGWASVF